MISSSGLNSILVLKQSGNVIEKKSPNAFDKNVQEAEKTVFFGLVLHLTDQMGAFSESALNSTSCQCILTPFQLLHEE